MPPLLRSAIAAVPMGLACFFTLIYLMASGALSESANSKRCVHTDRVVGAHFASSEYPGIKKHFEAAVRGEGESHHAWPRVLVINRDGTDDNKRRDKLMKVKGGQFPSREHEDRDEYPPAMGRGRGPGLTEGWLPRGWKADLAYVNDHENQAHGSSMGWQLMRYCDGVKFRYVWDR